MWLSAQGRCACAAARGNPPCAARAYCYDHLAGEVGVQLHEALLRQGYLQACDGNITSGRCRLVCAPGHRRRRRASEAHAVPPLPEPTSSATT